MEPRSAGGGALVGAILGAAVIGLAGAQQTDLRTQIEASRVEISGGRISITTDGGCEAQAFSRYLPRPGDVRAEPSQVGSFSIDSRRCEALKTMFACAAARDYGISACTP